MNPTDAPTREPKFVRTINHAEATLKHALRVTALAERVVDQSVAANGKGPTTDPGNPPAPSMLDEIDDIVLRIDRSIEATEMHLNRLAAELPTPGEAGLRARAT